MSQENVELTYRTYEAINRRDLDALLALMDDEVEAVPRVAAVEGSYRGHDGIRRWWESLLVVFPDFTIEVVEVHDLGDLTLATLRNRGHGAGSDIPSDETTWLVVRWQRRKCVWWRTYDTRVEAHEAAGFKE